MKNFEKYEKEIKRYGVNITIDKESGKASTCARTYCNSCLFKDYGQCNVGGCQGKIEWMYEEYNEDPLLSEEDQLYLKNLIKPFRKNVRTIAFYADVIDIIWVDKELRVKETKIPSHMLSDNKRLKCDYYYKLRELGL